MSGIRRSTIRTFGRSFLLSFGLGLLIPLQAIAAPVTISIGDAMVPEGNAGTTDLLFNVQREAGSDLGSNVVIPYGVLPSGVHPATAGVDYVAPPDDAGSLRIPLGQSVATLHVPVIGDTKPESNETLQVQFGKAAAFVPGANFPAAPRYPLATSPNALLTADFNSDGHPDIAVTNIGRGVTVLLGQSTGGFGAPVSFDSGRVPISIATGDFNGDGKPDLVTANYTDGSYTILLGDGTGGFGPANDVSIAVGVHPVSVTVADFNGDNKPDLAVTNQNDILVILLGTGTGTFVQANTYPIGTSDPKIGTYGLFVTSGDFNGDRKTDLAVADSDGNFAQILIGDGAGGFSAPANYPTGKHPLFIAAADFNADGKTDLAVASSESNRVSILLNNGAGGFNAPVNYPAGAYVGPLALGDFNGDGKLDIAVGNIASKDISILLGNGRGAFVPQPVKYSDGDDPSGLAAADFDGDGRLDLVVINSVINSFDGGVSLLSGNGAGGFSGRREFAVGNSPDAATSADFDGDGTLDLAVVNSASEYVSILHGDGAGNFTAAGIVFVGANPVAIASGDVDRDGHLDLAVANGGSSTVTVLRGDGAGGFPLSQDVPVPGAPLSLALADVSGDGNLDLVTANFDGNTVSVLLGNGAGGFAAPVNWSAGTGPIFVTTGDFNGDGKLDLAVANYEDNNVSILSGKGGGAFAPAMNFPVGQPGALDAQPNAIATGDFNEDGKPDLAVVDFDGLLSVLLGKGDGTFALARNFLLGNQPDYLAARDFDGDGHLDVAVVNSAGGNVSILLGDGAGGFADQVLFGGLTSPGALAVGDFDGDGDLDLAVPNQAYDNVAILLNTSAQPVVIDHGTATGTILDDDGTDTTPDAFRFTDLTGAPISTSLRSNSITVSGITAAAPLVLSGPADAVPQYSINGAGFKYYNLGKGQPTVSNGDTVQLRARTSATGGATVDLVLSIGSVSDTWSLTTATTASTPNAFDFKDKTNQPANRYIGSGGYRVSGINTPVSISISGDPSASFRINSGGYIAGPATVSNGDLVVLRLKSSATPGASVSAVVSIGGVSDGWTVTTAP